MGTLNETKSGTYDYPEEFRIQILALMLKKGWLSSYRSVVSADYFPSSQERDIARSILSHHEKFEGTSPTKADVLLDCQENRELINSVFMASNHSLVRTEHEIIEWAKSNALRLAIMASIDDFEQGQMDSVKDRIETALRTGSDIQDLGMSLVGDADRWMMDLDSEKVLPTPWKSVNRLIGGGLGEGELGIIMAPPNGKKTTSLVNIGYHAAGLMCRQNVIHFTLEMSEQKVIRRYAARMTNKSYGYDSNPNLNYKELLQKEARMKLRGEIKVKRFYTRDATVNNLADFIHRTIDNGFDPGLIIVDYPDLLRSKRKQKERRFELQEIYEDLRAMGGRFGKPVWGASQAGRQSFNKDTIGMEDVSEDIGKVNTADVVISVCNVKKGNEDPKTSLYIAKVRDGGIAGKQIPICVKFPAMLEADRYYDDEDSEVEEDDNWKWHGRG